MELFYREERDKDFFAVCEAVRRGAGTVLSVTEIADIARKQPAKSYYLSLHTIRMMVGDSAAFKKMHCAGEKELHICNLAAELKSEHPKWSDARIALVLSEKPAPHFFLSRLRARDLYYNLLKRYATNKSHSSLWSSFRALY